MWIKISVWAILAYSFHSSIVIDRPQQDEQIKKVYKGINIKDYCPKMKSNACPEGSHTMCLYFNPDRIAGPRCSGFMFNLSMTSEISELILDYVNEMRGRVATGNKDTLKGSIPMPRGYGLFKLKWDQELATFAQVLANTCLLRHDMCRATSKFPNPSQIATIVRFSFGNWTPIGNKSHSNLGPNFNQAKVKYAVSEAHKHWHDEKDHINQDMLEKAPDWTAEPNLKGRQFLQLIADDVTHIGCGISSYVEYHFKKPSNNKVFVETIFNTIHIVCNLSASLKKGKRVYRQTRPTVNELCGNDKVCKNRYNSKCGCPPGFDEDDRCLCTDPITYPPIRTCEKDKNCKPAVVLLPIFTVEDAPQHLISRKGLSNSELRENGADPLDEAMPYNPSNSKELEHDQVVELDYRRQDNQIPHMAGQIQGTRKEPSCQHKQQTTSFIMNSLEPPYTKKRIKGLYQSEEEIEENKNHKSFVQRIRTQHANRILPQRRSALTLAAKKNRGSIFANVPKFELPTHKTEAIQKKNTKVKTDVAPRKDFSKAKQALNEYLNEKKKNSQHSITDAAQHSDHDDDEQQTEPTTIKATLTIRPRFKNKLREAEHRNTSIEQSKPILKSKRKNKLQYLGFNIDSDVAHHVDNKNAIDEPDKKLMSLLDNLEQEPKHVDLDGTEKEIFDVKLKKIYGTVVKKTENSVSKQEKLIQKEDKHADLSDEEYSEFKRARHVNGKEEKLPYINDNIHKKIKTDRHKQFAEEIYPSYPRNRENSPKYVPDLDNPILSDGPDDPNRIEFDEQMDNTEDIVSNFRSGSRDDKESQSLYARPLPRDQNTLRPTMEKMDYVFRNTFNDVHEVKSKTSNIHKGLQRHRNSEYIHSRGKKFRINDDVKVLPYHLQYNRNEKRDRFRILNKYNDMKDKYRNQRLDDEKGTNLNRIDDKQRARYNEEILYDYEDDKELKYNNKNGKQYEENYGRDRDYREDLLSAERRKFYQEKLDHFEKRKYSPNEEYFRDPVRRRRPGKHILGIHKRRSNLTQRFYVPNRASRHNF